MARVPKEYTLGRVFIGGRPMEEFAPDELEAWRQRTVQRMGDSFNNYFSHHPEEYVRVVERYATENAAVEAASPRSAGA